MTGETQLNKNASCQIPHEFFVHGYQKGAILWIFQAFYHQTSSCNSSIWTDICLPDTSWEPVVFDSKESQRMFRQRDDMVKYWLGGNNLVVVGGRDWCPLHWVSWGDKLWWYLNSEEKWFYFNIQSGRVHFISSHCLEMNYRVTGAANKDLSVICIQMRTQSIRMRSQKDTKKNRGFLKFLFYFIKKQQQQQKPREFTLLIETSLFLMCGEKWANSAEIKIVQKSWDFE